MNCCKRRYARQAMGALALCAGIACAAAADTSPQFGAFGIDLSAQDKSVRPGDDFYRYVNGHWLATTKIPADHASWGSFDELAVQADTDVRSIIEAAAMSKAAKGTNAQKIGDFYGAFLDTSKIEQLGLAPAKAGLDEIEGLKTHAEIAALIARPGMPVDGPITYGISLDEKNPDRYIVGIE